MIKRGISIPEWLHDYIDRTKPGSGKYSQRARDMLIAQHHIETELKNSGFVFSSTEEPGEIELAIIRYAIDNELVREALDEYRESSDE